MGFTKKIFTNKSKLSNPALAGFIVILIGLCSLITVACGNITPSSMTASSESGPTPTSSTGFITNKVAVSESGSTPTPTPSTGFIITTPTPSQTTLQPVAAPVPTTGFAVPETTPPTQPGAVSRSFEHVFIIILENGNYSEAIAQPYLKQLAGQGALFTNYYGVSHPSYPNYLALVGGSTFGITSDDQTVLDQTSLVDLMEKAGISWKFYAEQYPANKCFTGTQSGDYWRKHLPVLSFKKVQSDPTLCSKVVPAGQLNQDIASGNLPNYSFYVPDQKNDGHDTGVAYGAKWLTGFLPNLVKNDKFASGTLVVVTFDESEQSSNNKIYTVLVGTAVQAGSTSNTRYTHYNLLRTIEDNFQLGNLGREDARATDFSGIWQVKK
jgi:hypothetical protein